MKKEKNKKITKESLIERIVKISGRRDEQLEKDLNYLSNKGISLEEISLFLDHQGFKSKTTFGEWKSTSNIYYSEKYGVPVPDAIECIHYAVMYIKAVDKFNKLSQRYKKDYFITFSGIVNVYYSVCREIEQLQGISKDFVKIAKKHARKFEREFSCKEQLYTATVPRTVKELTAEGVAMRNCLVMRSPWVAKDEMKVICIRKPDGEPYIDLILSKEDLIVWAILKNHVDCKGADLEACYKWYEETFGPIADYSQIWLPDGEWMRRY